MREGVDQEVEEPGDDHVMKLAGQGLEELQWLVGTEQVHVGLRGGRCTLGVGAAGELRELSSCQRYETHCERG